VIAIMRIVAIFNRALFNRIMSVRALFNRIMSVRALFNRIMSVLEEFLCLI